MCVGVRLIFILGKYTYIHGIFVMISKLVASSCFFKVICKQRERKCIEVIEGLSNDFYI